MQDVAIRAEHLKKCYRLGVLEEKHDTFFDQMGSWFRQPMRNWKKLRSLTNFSADDETATDVLWALREISFEIKRGEVIGFIGRNGAGKSTLLKLLSRITEPTAGRIDIYGRVSSLLEVGTGFHGELTGRENIYLNGTILGMRKHEIDQKFDEIVAFSGVERFIDTPVKRYSSGMTVRLAFAVAAHLEPEILVIDEVLSVGDSEFRQKSIGKMQEVSRGHGRTVLFVSHNMGAIESLCTRVIMLDKGRIVFDGNTRAGVQAYLRANTVRPEGNLSSVRRQGTGVLQFTNFFMTDADGRTSEFVQSGGTIVLHMGYEGKDASVMRNIDMGFGIHTATGDRVTTIYASDEGVEFASVPPKGVISCRIDHLPLKPGQYQIRAIAYCGSETADLPLEPVGVLGVESGDFYGNGRQPRDTSNAPVLVRSNWALASGTSASPPRTERPHQAVAPRD